MFHINGITECLKTVYLLSVPEDAAKRPNSTEELKGFYQAFLHRLQPEIPHPPVQKVEYVHEFDQLKTLCHIFNQDSTLTDIKFQLREENFTKEHVESQYARFQEHLPSLRKVDSALADVFELVVNTCFCAPADLAGGGTCSGALGVLWLDSRPTWTQQDFIEFCVHEMTHTLLFLDELRHRHYWKVSRLAEPVSFARSAILRRERPLDKVIHALVVATEVLLFRHTHGLPDSCIKLHPPSAILWEGAMRSVESLRSKSNLEEFVSPRYLELVKICEEKLMQMGPRRTNESSYRQAAVQ